MRWLYATPSSGHGQAQIGDGVQEILGADVGADLAARCRGFEQRREGGSEPLHEVAGQGVERRIAGVQGRASPRLVARNSVYRWSHFVRASPGSCAAASAGAASAQASISR